MWPADDAAPSARSGWIERVIDEEGPTQKHPADARVSHWFAAFCRRHSIDELPQLFHVVRGEMSLVGPRPVTRRELEAYYGNAAGEILSVKPGVTGLWQVSGRSRLTYRARVEMDLALVRRGSFRLYAGILLKTLREVVSGRDAW